MSAEHSHALYVHSHSVTHRLPAHYKVAALGVFVLAVVFTPATQVWAFGMYAGLLALVAYASNVPGTFVAKRMIVEVPFLIFALLLPFVGEAPNVDIFGASLSQAGLLAAWTIMAKGSCGVVASILLAATTEIPDILSGLTKLRVPATLVSIAGFMVRYLEVIGVELARMRVAMAARGYEPKAFWQVRALATSAGALFIRSYERGERVYLAMLSRGYHGTMPDLGSPAVARFDIAKALVVPALAACVAAAALVVQG